MKLKRLLPICLLAGSLMLSSCDDLLSNFMGGGNKKKSSDNEDSEYYGGQGYQGKQGATELSKEEWELAFSLEELALRRNCHLEVTQEEQQMKMDIDNGKFKIDVPYYEMSSIYMNFTGMSGKDIKGVQYYPNSDGTYSTHEDQEQLDLVMAEFGVIYLDYDAFTYDKSSKMYKADTYKYKVTYQGQTALSLDCSDCKVTIEDGFPKKLECNIVAGGNGQSDEEPEPMHYEANFSRYNAINVTLPNGNNNNGGNNQGQNHNTLPIPQGAEKVSYNELIKAYENREVKDYNHVEYVLTYDEGSTHGSSTLFYGVWEEDEGTNMGLDVSEMIITEETLEGFNTVPGAEGAEIEFYYDPQTGEYIVHAYYEVLGSSISTNIFIGRYFYLNAEFILMGDEYMSVEFEWSNVTIPDTKIMNVANRTFVGEDVKESNFVYYAETKLVTESATIHFDDEYVEMITTKSCSGNVVQDYYQVFVGTYEQNGNVVTVNFTHYADETGEYNALPTTLTYNLDVSQDKIIMPTLNYDDNNQLVELHLIFGCKGRFTGYISYLGGSSIEDNPLAGTYTYDRCVVELLNPEYQAEAEQMLAAIEAQEESLEKEMFYIASSGNVITYYSFNGDIYSGTYKVGDGFLEVEFFTAFTQEGEEQAIDEKAQFKFVDGEIYEVLLPTDNYIIYGIYCR